jgi:hypothetical protein
VQEQAPVRLLQEQRQQEQRQQEQLLQEQRQQEQLLLRRMRYTQSQSSIKLLVRRRPKGPYQSEFWTHPK